MTTYVDSLKTVLSKATYIRGASTSQFETSAGVQAISDLADKILEAFSDFQDIQYSQIVERDKKTQKIIKETKKYMMISLILGFLGTILLALIMPGWIALPFKKINDAIRELQDCNFDVSIYVFQNVIYSYCERSQICDIVS